MNRISSRRRFLRRCGLLGLATGGAAAGLSFALPAVGQTRGGSRAAYDYTARDTFDLFDTEFHASDANGQPHHTNESGGLAWGQSYVLASFMRMYEAYGDPYYLDRLIENFDQILENRDSVRGVTDWRGNSEPAWRAKNPYTVGIATLVDADGQDVLEVRSARAYADTATATVTSGSTAGTFTLEVRNDQYGYVNTFENLTMDPGSANYAPVRIYDSYPTTAMVTASDVRDDTADGAVPVAGETAFASQPVIFAVHTGMITYPVAAYVRTVYASAKLRRKRRYKQKADAYLEAVQAAVAVHDPEWETSGDLGSPERAAVWKKPGHPAATGRAADGEAETRRHATIGYYRWPKGMPVPYDGTEQPINQSVALGQTFAELGAATGDATYSDRARALAAMFAEQVSADANDAYVWPYWPKFGLLYNGYAKTGSPSDDVSLYTPSYEGGATQIEDLSHGAIDVEFAVLAHQKGLHFSADDMARFSRTYTINLATVSDGIHTTNLRVDGSGGLATEGQYSQAPRWMPVAEWDASVFEHAKGVFDDHQPGWEFGSRLINVGYLNWYANR